MPRVQRLFRSECARECAPNACDSDARRRRPDRGGAIIVLSAFLIIVMFLVLAFSVDMGYVLLARTEAQRAVDAGAMAGAALLKDGPSAAKTAAINFVQDNLVAGSTVPAGNLEVEVGTWDEASRTFIASGTKPNAIRVFAEQRNKPLFFGGLFGKEKFDTSAEAIAVFQPRDIMIVLDYSASMNDDSELSAIGKLGRPSVESNLQNIYTQLGSPKFGKLQWTPTSNSSSNTNTIISNLGLDKVPYPYSAGSWADYVNYVKSSSVINDAGYRSKYGYLTLINYWLEKRPMVSETPDLWKTSEQPITALKDAVAVFLAYMKEVETDDRVGLSVYTYSDGTAKLEHGLTRNFASIEDTSRHRQAGHYDHYTNIGAGLQKARLEMEKNARPGALKLIVLMTDGIANRPNNTTDAKKFVLEEAQKCVDAGFPVATVSVGMAADTALMQQVADMTDGVHFNVPGDRTVAEYEQQLKDVFRQIADDRPLKLVK